MVDLDIPSNEQNLKRIALKIGLCQTNFAVIFFNNLELHLLALNDCGLCQVILEY